MNGQNNYLSFSLMRKIALIAKLKIITRSGRKERRRMHVGKCMTLTMWVRYDYED